MIFRGKTPGGNWFEGNLFIGNIPFKHKQKKRYYIVSVYHKPDEVIPESIGMYTGLDDKNGTKIFGSIEAEGKMSKGGDIFKLPSGRIVKIKWKDGGFGYPSSDDFIGFLGHSWLKNILKGEVIGNQFDNPDLIGGRNE